MDTLRNIRFHTGHALLTWDTHRTDGRGQTIIGYRFTMPDGSTLFEGEDFAGSPMHADDSDDTLFALLGFLTLRPGDTDSEYFERYTPEQREWTRSSVCEALACELSADPGETSAGAMWVDADEAL